MTRKTSGKKIEISFSKDVGDPDNSTGTLTEEELLDYLVKVGELMGKNANSSNFKICVDKLSSPETFFEKLTQRITEANIEDIKIVLNMKLSK